MTDEDGITLTPTTWKVSATDTISKDEYEPYKAHTSLEGEMPLSVTLDADRRQELKARLLALHKDLQEIVQRAGENRIAAEMHADWGVRNESEEGEE